MFGHISTWTFLLSLILNACECAFALHHLLLLQIFCAVVVVLSPYECGKSAKYAWLLVKLLLIYWTMLGIRRRPCFSMTNIVVPVTVAMIYISFVDVNSVYECQVSKQLYMQTFVVGMMSYALVWYWILHGASRLEK